MPDILLQKEYTLSKDETGASLFDRLCDLGAEAVVEAMEKIENGTICPIPQELMLETLPHDKFDVPVDYVICA